ncbi:MAG: hypothetical protein DHS20C18_15870 [Saprospiraceae bacterium]|nr:MAG: hypothetical protein DHS20C18_15870 [Saprospiraceae bacterium]
MRKLEKEIVKTLLYFDIFSFPLKQDEIRRYCSIRLNTDDLSTPLSHLLSKQHIYRFGNYYQLNTQKERIINREKKHHISLQKLKIARRSAWIISQFPFVSGVAVSGSLSKYSADEKADIDFFIITHANRLWVCRSLLHIFKKLTYLFGKQHHFCMNYFLDENELELKDKNIFTAIESITVIPLYGTRSHQQFFDKNRWLTEYLPNSYPEIKLNGQVDNKRTWIKKIGEYFFAGQWGNWVNLFLLKFTLWWWRIKFKGKGYPMQYFNTDFRSTPGESKNHPNDYQRRVMNEFDQKVTVAAEQMGWNHVNQKS